MIAHATSLVTLRLKGFVRPEALGPDAAALIDAGLADSAKLGMRLTPQGREAADAVWNAERTADNHDALEAVHGAFVAINPQFKALVADWQLRGGAPNDHSDADYDSAIIARLVAVHAALVTIVETATAHVPRLSRYAPAFDHALSKLKSGERRWMAAPIIDSYHTLWFELHEELIRLTGRTRAAEAAAGHAA
jgi:hypothetical protein